MLKAILDTSILVSAFLKHEGVNTKVLLLPACGGQGGDKKSSAVNADATAIRTKVLEIRQERVFLSLDILSKVRDVFCHQK